MIKSFLRNVCVTLLFTGCASFALAQDRVQDRVQTLLEILARDTASVHSLYTTFVQEKKLSVLSKPLQSQGYMCMQRGNQVQKERLVWAYTSPQASGFASVAGKNYHWNGSAQEAKIASGAEVMVLKTVSEHIKSWVQVQPQALQKLYTIRVDMQDGQDILLLSPRQKQNFFERLEVQFLPEYAGIQSLLFREKNGDTMRITFTKILRNEALPPSCLIISE